MVIKKERKKEKITKSLSKYLYVLWISCILDYLRKMEYTYTINCRLSSGVADNFFKNVKNKKTNFLSFHLSTQKFLTSTGNLILNLIKFLKIGPKTPKIDGQTKGIIE